MKFLQNLELAEREKVRVKEWNGEFGYAGLDSIGSIAKKIRTRRFFFQNSFDRAENEPPNFL